MIKLGDMINSQYLKKEHLIDDETGEYKVVELTIEDIEKGTVKNNKGQEKDVTVVYFQKGGKGMCLNAGNRTYLINKFGNRPRLWVGEKVFLGVDPSVKYAGKVVGGLVFKDSK